MEFIVLKDIAGRVKGTIYEPDTSEGVTVEYAMMLLLPEYFVEFKTGKFNDDWEYTGAFRPPREGDAFINKSGRHVEITSWDFGEGANYYILRRIRTYPTKQEILMALDASIGHWLKDILPLAIKGKTDILPFGTGVCALCQLFLPVHGGYGHCQCCPMDCGAGSYPQFKRKRTVVNALAMIIELHKCKDKLLDEDATGNEDTCG